MEQSNTQNMGTEKKSGLVDQAGELLEKVGKKISEAGATTLGQKIHDLGDSVEKTHKDPQHPEKV